MREKKSALVIKVFKRCIPPSYISLALFGRNIPPSRSRPLSNISASSHRNTAPVKYYNFNSFHRRGRHVVRPPPTPHPRLLVLLHCDTRHAIPEMQVRREFDSRHRGLRDLRSLRVLRIDVIPRGSLVRGEFAEFRDRHGLFLGDRLFGCGDIVHLYIPHGIFNEYEKRREREKGLLFNVGGGDAPRDEEAWRGTGHLSAIQK